VVIIAVLLLVCILIGRALCGWACPIGFIQDLTSRGLRRLKISPYEPPKKIHNKFKTVKYALLFIILAVAASIGLSLLIHEPMGEEYREMFDPMCQTSPICLGCPTPILRYVAIDVGYNLNPNFDNPSNIFQMAVFLVFFIGMIAIPRFWCRYVCPIGALSSIFNKFSILHIRKDQEKCTKCNYCVDVCHTRVESIMTESELERIGDMSCTFCGECVDACPEKALTINFGNKVLYRGGKLWYERKKNNN
jgi:polyferredoxin